MTRRHLLALVAGLVALALAALAIVVGLAPRDAGPTSGDRQRGGEVTETRTPTPVDHGDGNAVWPPASAPVVDPASLPEARFDSLNLLPAYDGDTEPDLNGMTVHALARDVTIYDADGNPRARLDAVNFAGEPTVVLAVRSNDAWAQVLAPDRSGLPSRGDAHAQSAGYVRLADLGTGEAVQNVIRVALASQTLRVEQLDGTVLFEAAVGIGTAATPTPTGLSYVQSAYQDPALGTVLLTGAHSTAKDSLYGDGSTSGPVALHQHARLGASLNGCIRLSPADLAAVLALVAPGTPIITR